MKTIQKLEKIFNDGLHSSRLKKALIVRQDEKYFLYGRFSVSPDMNNNFMAVDFVTKERVHFTILKHAIAWCVLIHSRKWQDASRLASLDLRMTSLNTDVSVHRNLLKSSSSKESKEIFFTKLQEDSFRRRCMMAEIDALLKKTRNAQDRNFETISDKKITQ